MGRGRSGSTTGLKSRTKSGKKIHRFDEEGLEGLEFTTSRFGEKENVIVLVDPQKLDANWSQDKGLYIPPGGGGAEIKGRREDFRNFLKKGVPIETSKVVLSKKGQVGFVDGRHRYSVFRDNGVKRIPISVPRGQAEKFKKLFN